MKRSRGFTLIETVVALAILALSLSAIQGLISGSALRLARAVEREQATLLAQSLLEETLARPGKPGEEEGSFGDFRWLVRRSPSQAPSLLDILVKVSRAERRGSAPAVELRSLQRMEAEP